MASVAQRWLRLYDTEGENLIIDANEVIVIGALMVEPSGDAWWTTLHMRSGVAFKVPVPDAEFDTFCSEVMGDI